MHFNNVIRETKSICPICLEFLKAFIIERDGKVFLSKICLNHGQFEILLSKTAEFYKKLDRFYFEVMDEEKDLFEYEIWLTLKCNLNCHICHLGNKKETLKIFEPSYLAITNFIKKCKAPFYILSGGEPTCRDDLASIIQIFKKYRKFVSIHTNGLKLLDIKYLNELKKSGLGRVNLQFDGFDRKTYEIFRGKDLLDTKLEVLENLKALKMPTDLNVTIAKNVNEEAVVDVIEFATKNDFIKGINFFTICFLGNSRGWPLVNYIMPDEVVNIMEEKTRYKISKKNIFLFQKLNFAIKSWLKQRFCLYSRIYVFVRNRSSYEPIDKYLNFCKTDLWLDKYGHIYKKNKFFARILLAIALPFSLLRISSFKILKSILVTGCSYFLKTPHYLKNRSFLYLSFSTGCDPYKFDYSIVRNCQDEIIHTDSNSEKLKNCGCDGFHSINLERRYLLNKNKKYV